MAAPKKADEVLHTHTQAMKRSKREQVPLVPPAAHIFSARLR
jgi:hypothetical protein